MYYIVSAILPRTKRTLDLAPKESGALRLAELRKLAGRSQARVATSMGTTQSAVSRTERQGDLLLSTLDQYVAALGGSLKLCVELNGTERRG